MIDNNIKMNYFSCIKNLIKAIKNKNDIRKKI